MKMNKFKPQLIAGPYSEAVIKKSYNVLIKTQDNYTH